MNQQNSESAPGSGHAGGTASFALPRKAKLPKGESQWTIVWRQFRKRKLAVASVCVIWLLISVSIWAPIIANDRPLMYVGYNRQEYQESARTARIMLTQFIEQKWKAAKTPWLEWRGTQIETLMLQVELMGQQLSGNELAELGKLQEEFLRAVTVDDPDDVDVESLNQLRTVVRQKFDGAKVKLSSRQFWPVLRSLSGVEFGFLVWNIAIVVWPILSWVIRRTILLNSERQLSSAVTWLVIAGLPAIAGSIWHLQVPLRLDRTNYKSAVLANQSEQLSKANVVFEGVIWPPVSYGLDEDHLSRKFARPAILPPDNTPAAPSSSGTSAPRGELGPWDSPHWLGTDDIGRDILARMIWGGRVSLTVGIVAVGIYVSIGIVVGAISGYFRGAADMIISRIIEVVICFPSFFLILTIVAFLGPSIFNIMVVIGVTGWTGIARLVRAEFLRLAEQEFVLAGRALGYSPWRIIFKHVLPNALAPVMVSATFGIAGAILTESALSFLGFGITVPMPSWGGILSSGREAIFRAPWLIYFPGTAIFITITAYNLVGEALRDAADPRLRN